MMSTLLPACIILFLLVFPSSVFAATVSITSIPSDLTALETFTLSASASALPPNTSFFVKIRLGTTITSLTKGQTFNASNDSPNDWLSDTDSYSLFSQIMTDGVGNWLGEVVGRPSESAFIGDNYVVLRLRKTDSTTNNDSNAVSVHVSPAPTATATPTPTPTNTSTPTPTPSATSAPTATSVPISASTPIATPTRTVTATPTTEISDEIISNDVPLVPAILGVEDASVSGASVTRLDSKRPLIVAMLFVSAGLALFAIASLITKINI